MSVVRWSHDALIRTVFSSCRQPCRRQRLSQNLSSPQDHVRRQAIFQQTAAFSTSPTLQKRKKGAQKQDPRIRSIRYHLKHYKIPRPLRFSRLRALRHWTIHRAWQLYQHKRRKAQELELERLYNSMAEACEVLRLKEDDGNGDKEAGRLYRAAMQKQGIWRGFPIEYAKCQTDYPSKEGWNHEWQRS